MIRTSHPKPRGRLARSRVMVVTALLIISLGLVACATEEGVDRLTIVNGTPFDVEVQVTDSEKESWLTLGQATHESSTVNEVVTDMGATWVFRFHYGGQVVGDLTVSREDLTRNKWRVEVPTAVAERMRGMGFEPAPDR